MLIIDKKIPFSFSFQFFSVPLHPQTKGSTKLGALAQLVEHRTENPCVPGSIPGGTTPPFITSPAKVFGLSGAFFMHISLQNNLGSADFFATSAFCIMKRTLKCLAISANTLNFATSVSRQSTVIAKESTTKL